MTTIQVTRFIARTPALTPAHCQLRCQTLLHHLLPMSFVLTGTLEVQRQVASQEGICYPDRISCSGSGTRATWMSSLLLEKMIQRPDDHAGSSMSTLCG